MEQFSKKDGQKKISKKKATLVSAVIGVFMAFKLGGALAPDHPGHHGSGLSFAVVMVFIAPIIIGGCILLGLLFTSIYNKTNK